MSAATITLLTLAGAAILYITEIIPLAVTSMCVPIVLAMTGVIDVNAVFSGLIDKNVILFAGMFVVGASLFETGVAVKIGSNIVKIAGKGERRLLVAIMIVAASLSAFLSNTGTTAVMMPVAIAIATAAGYKSSKFLMPLAIAVGLGGTITFLGTPPNLLVKSFLESATSDTFSFFEFAGIGIPLTVAGIIYMLTIGIKLVPDRGIERDIVKRAVKAEAGVAGEDITYKQIISVFVLVATVLGMVFEKQVGIPLHIIAVLGALILVTTGVIKENRAYRAIDWTTIFLFAGMLPLATALDKTGAGETIAFLVIDALGPNASSYVITGALFLLACGLTQFMSNTATTAILAPISIAIAKGLGADPRAPLMAIAIAASCAFATPVATPPNALVLGPGGYRFTDYVKVGLPLIIICFVISILIIPIFYGPLRGLLR